MDHLPRLGLCRSQRRRTRRAFVGKARRPDAAVSVSARMNREHHRWFSPALGREMELLIFGHAGARVLVFPSSMGRFFEWEDRGMVHALGEHLERGWLQLYCVDSVDSESWYADTVHPHWSARRHEQYEQYLIHEVLPLSVHRNGNMFLITTGASWGAYHAAALAFRHPHLVGRMLGLSGVYDVR